MLRELNISSYKFKRKEVKHLINHLIRLGQPKILFSDQDGDEKQRYAAVNFSYDSGYKTAWMLNFPDSVSQILTSTSCVLLQPSDVYFVGITSPNNVDLGITCNDKDYKKSPAVIEMLRELVGVANHLIETTDYINTKLQEHGLTYSGDLFHQISLDPSLIGRKTYFVG